jgi:DNA-binding PadR family transcriptional regulator
MNEEELRLLRSYQDRPRIWDAASIVPQVWALADKGLIEQLDPHDSRRYRLTEAGREALKAAL